MYKLVLLLLLTASFMTLHGQKMSYDIPEGYENSVSKEDYKKIVDMALVHAKKRYAIDEVKEGTIFTKEGQQFNLHNLIGKCTVVKDKNQWSKIIEGHFENIYASIDEQSQMNPEDYESIKKYLSLRIYPATVVNMRGGTSSLVVKTDLEDTYTLLMLDLPGAFTPVQKEMFNLWKKDTTEVFRVAQANINKQEIQKVTKQFDIDGTMVEISFLGNEDYAASYGLDLVNNSPDMVGEWGSAVAMPNKGIVDICKISKDKPLDFVKFIQRLKARVEQSYLEHEQPISDQFFWYYKGKFTKINVITATDGKITVVSPMGLSTLMTEKK